MSWSPARRLLGLANGHPRDGVGLRAAGGVEAPEPLSAPPARAICVASGKGGTGKSVVSAALAALFASRGRTLVLDADLGVGNAHILQDASPERSCVEVVEGRASVRDVRVACGAQLDLVAGGSGVSRMAELTGSELARLAGGLEEIEPEYRFVVVDSAAGVSPQTMHFAAASDLVLLVTTPDLTALTDAYAFLKVLSKRRDDGRAVLVVNRADSELAARQVAERLQGVAERFLGWCPRLVACLPNDPAVTLCVNRRTPVVRGEPASPFARAMRPLAVALLGELGTLHPRGVGRTLLHEIGFARRAH